MKRPKQGEVVGTLERALDLMYRDRQGRYTGWGVLILWMTPPVIRYKTQNDGCSGGGSGGSNDFAVTAQVADQLQAGGFLESTCEDREFQISPAGQAEAVRLHHVQRAAERKADKAARK